jgi:hypothetical protein
MAWRGPLAAMAQSFPGPWTFAHVATGEFAGLSQSGEFARAPRHVLRQSKTDQHRSSVAFLDVDRQWFSPRALRLHLALAVLVAACALLCDWQVHRALSGNSLSWAYVFEWPFFAAYGVFVWWKLLRDKWEWGPPPDQAAASTDVHREEFEESDEPDQGVTDELAAYNRYLAELNEKDRPKRW